MKAVRPFVINLPLHGCYAYKLNKSHLAIAICLHAYKWDEWGLH